MARKTLEDAVKKALSGDAKAAKAIEAVLQNVSLPPLPRRVA